MHNLNHAGAKVNRKQEQDLTRGPKVAKWRWNPSGQRSHEDQPAQSSYVRATARDARRRRSGPVANARYSRGAGNGEGLGAGLRAVAENDLSDPGPHRVQREPARVRLRRRPVPTAPGRSARTRLRSRHQRLRRRHQPLLQRGRAQHAGIRRTSPRRYLPDFKGNDGHRRGTR